MKNKFRYFAAAFITVVSLLMFSQNLFAQIERNPLIEFCTGTWCGYCPCGDSVVEDLQEIYPNLIALAYHGGGGGDPFQNFPGNQIISLLQFPGYPTAAVDRATGAPTDYSTWTGKVNSRMNIPATVSIDLQRSFNETTGHLDATVDITPLENLTGQFYYNIVLTEDSLIYPQTNYQTCVTGGSVLTNFVHYWVVRAMINSATGESVNSGSTWNTGETITKTASYDVPLTYNPDKCNLIVFVYKQSSPLYSAQVQQAGQWTLIAPDYLATIFSSSPDQIIANNGTADFSVMVYNQGLLDDSYYIDVTMTAPNGWTGEFTTPNGTFPFGTQDLVAVPSGDSLSVDLSVSANYINGSGEATIKFTSMNDPNIFVEKTFSIVTITGVAGLIIDASGEGYADILLNGVEQEFEYPLGIVTREALYPGIDLTNFTLICWSTGNAYPVFTEDEVDALMPFLDNGGRLLINGQNIGEDIFGPSGQSQFAQDFYHDYLHSSYVDDSGLTFFFRGIDGDPISQSHLYSVVLSDIYTRSPDQFIPYDASAASLFTFSNYSQYNSIRADDGVNRVVYFGFGLEQVTQDTTRDTLITRAINWLMNGVVVGVPNENISPASFNLSQNYPNPFNPATKITYSIPNESQVNLKIYDVMGREVAVLVNGRQQAGTYEVNFNAASLASGTYFYKLTAGDFVSVKKMILLK